MNKTVIKIKRINASPVFFLAALTFSLAALTTALGTGSIAAGVTNTFQALKTSQPLVASIEQNMVPVFTSLPIYLYVQAGFSFLVAIGMWMHFFANKSDSDSVSTAGLSLIKICKGIELALVVIVYILCAIVLGMTSFVMIEFIKEAAAGQVPNGIYIAFAVAAAVYIFIFILTILYFRGILHTLKSIKMTLSTGVIMGKVSLFVIVINYFIAVGTLVGAILSPSVFGLVAGLLNTACLVFISISMASLRSEMRYIAARGGESVQ